MIRKTWGWDILLMKCKPDKKKSRKNLCFTRRFVQREYKDYKKNTSPKAHLDSSIVVKGVFQAAWRETSAPHLYSRQCLLKEAQLRRTRRSPSARHKALKRYAFSSPFSFFLFLLLFFFLHKPWTSCRGRGKSPNLSF